MRIPTDVVVVNPGPRRRGTGGSARGASVSGTPITDHKRDIAASLQAVQQTCLTHYGKKDTAAVMKLLKKMPMSYNKRLQGTAGRFMYQTNYAGTPRAIGIEMHGHAAPGLDSEHYIGLMIHEMLHAVVFFANSIVRKPADRIRPESAHGPHWKSLMRGAGQPDDAQYSHSSAFGKAMLEGRQKAGQKVKGVVDPAHISGLSKSDFHIGSHVKFWNNGKWLRGTITKLNPKRAKVRPDEGGYAAGTWGVVYARMFLQHPIAVGGGRPPAPRPRPPAPRPRPPAPRPVPKPKPKPKPKPRPVPKPKPKPKPKRKPTPKPRPKPKVTIVKDREGFRMGQKVSFMVGKKKLTGKIEKLNAKSALVGLRNGEGWTVDYKDMS